MSTRRLQVDLDQARQTMRRSLLSRHAVAVPAHQREAASDHASAWMSQTGTESPVRPVAGRSGVSPAVLGKNTKSPSTKAAGRPNGETRAERREDRYRLRERLGRLTTNKRVASCGQHRISNEINPTIRVQQDAKGKTAHYTGVQLCGGIHLCPVCSPRIRQERATEIDQAAATWIAQHCTGAVMLLTLTLPHDHGERLADVLGTVRESFGALVSGRAWQTTKLDYGVQFYIASHDSTVGRNGWHPHLHILLFGRYALDDEDLAALERAIWKRWSDAVTKRGHRRPSRKHGVQLERARNRTDVARYVCQVVAGDDVDDARTVPVALEMARGDLKTSHHAGQRTVWQLLRDLTERRAREGEWTPAMDAADERDLALWLEWEKATKGVRAIRWSRGLRVAVGLDEEKSDEEIVAAEVGGVDVYVFPDTDSWKAVASTPGARAALIRAAETGGKHEVEWLITETLARWRMRRVRHGPSGQPVPRPVTLRGDAAEHVARPLSASPDDQTVHELPGRVRRPVAE
jgi:hypothetical protein